MLQDSIYLTKNIRDTKESMNLIKSSYQLLLKSLLNGIEKEFNIYDGRDMNSS